MSDSDVSNSDVQPKKERKFTSEVFLGAMVAVLSILTAIAAYQGAIAGAEADDAELKGLQSLTESNTEYLIANQDIIYDYLLFDNFYLSFEELDEDDQEYIVSSFSEALSNSFEREDGPFDDAYYEEQFEIAGSLYNEAFNNFDVTEEKGEKEDGLQMIVLIFALGLSFAAWASLADKHSKTRMIFATLAIISTIFGIVLWVF